MSRATLLADLTAAGLVPKISTLILFDDQADLANIVDPGTYDGQINGVPTWTPGKHMSCPTNADYVDTTLHPDTDPKTTVDNCGLHLWTNDNASAQMYAAGVSEVNWTVIGRHSATEIRGRLAASNAGVDIPNQLKSTAGFLSMCRSGAGAYNWYAQGDPRNTFAQASAGPQTGAVWIGCVDNFGAPFSGGPLNIAAAAWTTGLNAAETLALYVCLRDYFKRTSNYKSPVTWWADSMPIFPLPASAAAYLIQTLAATTRPSESEAVNGETSTQVAARQTVAARYTTSRDLIWCGTNNINDPAATIADYTAMRAASIARTGILPIALTPHNWADGTMNNPSALHTDTLTARDGIAALFGTHFLDSRQLLIDNYNPGVPQDVTDFNNDVPPSTLRSDDVHLNAAGSLLVATALDALIESLENPAPPIAPGVRRGARSSGRVRRR